MSTPYFDPNDPFAPVPRREPLPPVKGNTRTEPGWINRGLIIASLAGLAVFAPPLFFKLRNADADTQLTGPVILEALGFVFSLIVFAGTVGARFAFWLADTFVNLIFNIDGSGWTAADRRKIEEEEAAREARRPGGPRRDGDDGNPS